MNAMKFAVAAAALSVAVATTAFAAPTTFTTDANRIPLCASQYRSPRLLPHSGIALRQGNRHRDVRPGRQNRFGWTSPLIPSSVDTGSDLFNGHIQATDFLDTADYGTATFKSTSVKFSGDKPVSIEGNLTLKGVTKPVTLTGDLVQPGAEYDEEGRDRRGCQHPDQAQRLQHGQIRAPSRRRCDTVDRAGSGRILIESNAVAPQARDA